MANYQYTGCVMGVTEGGVTQLIAPTEPQYPITRPVNAYTERLSGVGLLVGAEGSASVSYINLALPITTGQIIS